MLLVGSKVTGRASDDVVTEVIARISHPGWGMPSTFRRRRILFAKLAIGDKCGHFGMRTDWRFRDGASYLW
jgi:hypothetical protein